MDQKVYERALKNYRRANGGVNTDRVKYLREKYGNYQESSDDSPGVFKLAERYKRDQEYKDYVRENGQPTAQSVAETINRNEVAHGMPLPYDPQSNAAAFKRQNDVNAQSATEQTAQILDNAMLTGAGKGQQLYDLYSAQNPVKPITEYGSLPEYATALAGSAVKTQSAMNTAVDREYQRRFDEAKQKVQALTNPAYVQTVTAQKRKIDQEAEEASKEASLFNVKLRPANETPEEKAARNEKFRETQETNQRLQTEKAKIDQQYQEMLTAPYYLLMFNEDFAEKSGFADENASDKAKRINRAEGFVQPNPEDYENYGEYLKALTKYRGERLAKVEDPDDYLDTLSKEETQIYNYLRNTQGDKAADEYLNTLRPELDRRATAVATGEIRDFASKNVFTAALSDIASVVAAPLRIRGAIGSIADRVFNGNVNPYAYYNRTSNEISAAREGSLEHNRQAVADIVSWFGGGEKAQETAGDIAAFLKGAGLSALESAWTGYLSQSFASMFGMGFQDARTILNLAKTNPGTVSANVLNTAQHVMNIAEETQRVVMGAGAVSDVIRQAKERGLSDDQAFTLGLIGGFAEFATEKWSVEKLFNTDWNAITLGQKFLKGLETSGIEGLEEVASDVINGIADVMVSGDKNEWEQRINEIVEKDHKSRDEAFKEVFLEKMWDTLESFGSGFISAGGEVVAEAGRAYISNQVTNKVHSDLQKRYDKAVAEKERAEKNGNSDEVFVYDYIAGIDKAMNAALETVANNKESGEYNYDRAVALADLINEVGKAYPTNTRQRTIDYLMEAYRQSGDSIDRANIKMVISDLQNFGKDIDNYLGSNRGQTETTTRSEAQTESAPVEEQNAETPVSAQEAVQTQNEQRTEQNTVAENAAQNAAVSGETAESAYTSAFKNYGVTEGMSSADIAKTLYRSAVGNNKRGARVVTDLQTSLMQKLRNSGEYSAEELSAISQKMGEVERETAALNRGDLQKAVNVLNDVFKQYGVKGFVIDDSMVTDYNNLRGAKADKGFYKTSDNMVHISPLQTTSEALSSVVAHEVVHDAVARDTSEGKTVSKQFISDILAAKNKMLSSDQRVSRTGKAYIDNTPESRYVAGYAEDLIADFGLTDEGKRAVQEYISVHPTTTDASGATHPTDTADAFAGLVEQDADGFYGMFNTGKNGLTAREYMNEEMAAHFIEQLGGANGNALMRELVRDHRSVIDRIIDWIRKILKMPDRKIGDAKVYQNLIDAYEKAVAEETGTEAKSLKANQRSEGELGESVIMEGADGAEVREYSIDSGIEPLGLSYVKHEDGSTHFVDSNGNEVKEVTTDMIMRSDYGALLTSSADHGLISEEDVTVQAQFLADTFNMMLKTNDIDLIWAVNSTIGFQPVAPGVRDEKDIEKYNKSPIYKTVKTVDEKTGKVKEQKVNTRINPFAALTKNSDKQYGSTIDFTTICGKTQAIIDAMSETMKKLNRGLTQEEIVNIVYKEVADAGEPVPCPVCYVFARWVGLGGLFDKIYNMQNKYRDVDTKALKADIEELRKKIEDYSGEAFGKNKEKVYKDLKKRWLELDTKRANAELGTGDALTAEESSELEKISQQMDYIDQWTWLNDVRLSDNYKEVPPEILFDINAGNEFAEQYPESWKFRTTRGPSMGKAASPYQAEHLGQIISGIASPSLINDKRLGDPTKNEFLGKTQKGRPTKTGINTQRRGIINAQKQNLLNGERMQSTSDFRYEFALDYLMAFFELQSVGAKVQMYTKVPEMIPLAASLNAEVNCSLMPLGDGYDKNGNLVFSDVTGMSAEDAFRYAAMFDNVQPIMVGINRQHILMCMDDDRITFIIPYHSSGTSEGRYVAMMAAVGEEVTNRDDYSNYQNDVEYPTDPEDAEKMGSPVATPEQLAARSARKKILTGDAVIVKTKKKNNKTTVVSRTMNLTEEEKQAVRGNPILEQLHARFYHMDVDGNPVKVDPKYLNPDDVESGYDSETYYDNKYDPGASSGNFLTSDQAEKIMPFEFWDKTVTIDNAKQNAQIFFDYCKYLGIHPRFSGYAKEREYNKDYDFTQADGYWKTIPDRKMFNNTWKQNIYGYAGKLMTQYGLTDAGTAELQKRMESGMNYSQALSEMYADDTEGFWDYFEDADGAKEFMSGVFTDRPGQYHVQKAINISQFKPEYLLSTEADPDIAVKSKQNKPKKTPEIVNRVVDKINTQTEESTRKSRDVTPEMDKEYERAVKSGDMETAQKMVNERADQYMEQYLLPNDDDEKGFKYHRGASPTKTFRRYAVMNVSPSGFRAAYAGNRNPTPVGVWLDAQNLPSYLSDVTQFDDGSFATYIPGDTGVAASEKFSPELLEKYGLKKSQSMLLERGGKHSSDVPNFSQMNLAQDENGKPVTNKIRDGALPHNKLIFEIEYGLSDNGDLTDYVKENGRMMKGKNQGLANIQPNQYYDFKTNPNAVGNWGLGGTFRVVRLVPYSEIVEKTRQYKQDAIDDANLLYQDGKISKKDRDTRIKNANAIQLQKWVGGYHPEDFNLSVESVDEMVREGAKAKLTDAVTYDDYGKVIPLSERFNPNVDDLRRAREIETETERKLRHEQEKNAYLRKQFNGRSPFGAAFAVAPRDFESAVKYYSDRILGKGRTEGRDEIREKLRKLYDIMERPISGKGDTAQARFEEARQYAEELASEWAESMAYDKVIDSHIEGREDRLSDFYKSAKNWHIYYEIPEATAEYGDKNTWNLEKRKHSRLRLFGVKDSDEGMAKGGISIEDAYDKLKNDYPDLLNEVFDILQIDADNINGKFDQLDVLSAAVDLGYKAIHDPYEYEMVANPEYVEKELATDLLLGWTNAAKATFASKLPTKQEVEKMQKDYDKKISDLTASLNAQSEDLKRTNDYTRAQLVSETPLGEAMAISKAAAEEIEQRYRDMFGGNLPYHEMGNDLHKLWNLLQRGKRNASDTEESRWNEINEAARDIARKVYEATSYQSVLNDSIGDSLTYDALKMLYNTLSARKNADSAGYYYIIQAMQNGAQDTDVYRDAINSLRGMKVKGFNSVEEAEKSGRKSIQSLYDELINDGAYGTIFNANANASDFDKFMQIANGFALAKEANSDPYDLVQGEVDESDVSALANDILYMWMDRANPTRMAKRINEEREKAQRRAERVEERTERREAAMEERFNASYDRLKRSYERRQQKVEDRLNRLQNKLLQKNQTAALNMMRKRIQKRVQKLNEWLEKPDKKHHIPEKLREPIAQILESIGDIKLKNGKVVTAARMREIINGDTGKFSKFVDDLANGLKGVSAADGKNNVVTETFLKNLEGMIKSLNDQRMVVESLIPKTTGAKSNETGLISTTSLVPTQTVGEAFNPNDNVLSREYMQYMTYLKDILDMVYHAVVDENKMIVNNRRMEYSDISRLLGGDLAGRKSNEIETMHKTLKSLTSDYLNAVKLGTMSGDLFFRMLGDNWVDIVGHSFREGQNRQAKHMAQYAEFMSELVGNDNPVEEPYDITNAGYNGEYVQIEVPVENGVQRMPERAGDSYSGEFTETKTMNVTRSQLMQLYALWQRPAGRKHLEKGGACFTNDRGQDFKQNTVKVDEDFMKQVESILTDREKKIVDRVVKFLSDEAAEWGNETSRYVYGFNMYTEDHYFPIDVANYSLDKSMIEQAREGSPLNPSFSNRVVNSTKPISLTDFFAVADDHVRQMAVYNAYAAACNDLDRIIQTTGLDSVLREKVGNAAITYLKNFIQTTGGTQLRDPEGIWANLFRKAGQFSANNYKRQAVAFNLSTAIKQTISAVRAANEIDAKYLAKGMTIPGSEEYKRIKQTMQENSGVAYIKSLGFSDTGFGQTVRQLYDKTAVNDSGIIRGALASSKAGRKVINAYDKTVEAGMWLAAKADEATWVNLWNACEHEVKDQHPELGGDAFTKKVAERFNDVIGKTQVVDTALDTAPILRHREFQILFPFMNEPTKTLGNLVVAFDRMKQTGDRSPWRKAVATTIIANVLLEPLITSIMSAWRDEKFHDDDWWETFLEKMYGIKDGKLNWRDLVTSNTFGGLFQYPGIQSAYETIANSMQNYDNPSIDTAGLLDLVNKFKAVMNNSGKTPRERTKTQGRMWLELAEAIAANAGIPLKTVRRQLSAVARTGIVWSTSDWAKWEYQKLSNNLENASARSQKGFYDILASVYKKGDVETYKKMLGELNDVVSDKSTLIGVNAISDWIEKRGAEVKPGTDMWNATVQARFRLDHPVKGWQVENFVTRTYVQAEKAGIKDDAADNVLLNIPTAYSYEDDDGDNVKMNPAQYEAYADGVGDLSYKILVALSSKANAQAWSQLNIDQKVKAIDYAYKYAKAKGKKDFNPDYNINGQGKWMVGLYESNARPAEIASAVMNQARAYGGQLNRKKGSK